MSRYVALLDGGKREETVEVTAESPGVYRVRVRGREHRVDAFRHDYGTVSLLVDHQSYSVQLDAQGTKVRVQLRDAVYPLEILDERRLRMRRAASRLTVEGRQTIAAPMGGKVVKVLVRPGDPVKAGQAVVIVEAMKMENELKSPKDGTVVEVLVQEGQAVEASARLAEVE